MWTSYTPARRAPRRPPCGPLRGKVPTVFSYRPRGAASTRDHRLLLGHQGPVDGDGRALYALVLAAVFWTWNRTERTLSIHTIDSSRRELFYWAAVVATFAMGTAVGDLTAVTLHLGYLLSAVLFACMIAIPAIGYRWLGWNSIVSFWCAYVLTRPLGASVADWLGKPPSLGALAGAMSRLPWP